MHIEITVKQRELLMIKVIAVIRANLTAAFILFLHSIPVSRFLPHMRAFIRSTSSVLALKVDIKI